MAQGYDVIVVGAGILGLSVALAASRAGKSVCVLDREAQAIGASVRNFGFVTVTGQTPGAHWQRARRSRDVWQEIAPLAGIEVLQSGQMLVAERAEAADLLHQFLAGEMGADCQMMRPADALARAPNLRLAAAQEIMFSPHELRVESREAIPKLTTWLQLVWGVTFQFHTAVLAVEETGVITARGKVQGAAVVVCPGDDFTTLYPEIAAGAGLRKCSLQMLRLQAAQMPRLQSVLVGDHSLARNEGFTSLPGASALIRQLEAECPAHRAAGVHLIVAQSADGSLVVGDSHVYGASVDPFGQEAYDALILELFDGLIDQPDRQIIARWSGSYASATDRQVLLVAPEPHVRLAMVTGGSGASTGFAFGEEIVADLFG